MKPTPWKKQVRKRSLKTLKRSLDEIYSKFIRQSAANHEGNVLCYCGVYVPWQESDNSHYIPRGCLALRYDPRNTHPSCHRCNRFMGGNLQAYSIFLEEKYGSGILQQLEKDRRQTIKNFPFEEKIKEYTEKLALIGK